MAKKWKEDAAFPDAVSPHLAVSLLGWLKQHPDDDPAEYRLMTDPWGDEWVTIKADEIVAQIPGTKRPDGRSVIWVERGAAIVQHRSWIASDYAQHETLLVRGGGGGSGGGAPAPPGDKKPPG